MANSQVNTYELHEMLKNVVKGSSLELVSSPESFVQQLRCNDEDPEASRGS